MNPPDLSGPLVGASGGLAFNRSGFKGVGNDHANYA